MALNVLVVDDSAVMRSMIIKTLRLCGLPLSEMHEASHGEEGLQMLEEHWIDLMVLDINMPVMNGEEMIRCVRQNPDTEELPVLVVSTESSDTRIAVLRHYGAEFIHKPFTPEDMRATVVDMTGVSDEEYMGDGSVASSGPDF
jgi:two-component system chemotaxis response regulator CheY